MIYGQSTDTLFTISDTTPGMKSILVILLIAFLCCIVYHMAVAALDMYKVKRLKACEKELRKALQNGGTNRKARQTVRVNIISQSDEEKLDDFEFLR